MQYKRLYREIQVPAKENGVINYLYIHIDWNFFCIHTPGGIPNIYKSNFVKILKISWIIALLNQHS